MDISRLADKLRSQNFGANDSAILSAINHPLTAAQKGADWFAGQVNRAANIPDQYDNPNPLAGYTPEQQVGGALNLAGLMQTGGMPFAPESAGGVLGTFIGPKSSLWNAEKAATAEKLLDEGVDPAQVWKDHLIGRLPSGHLFSEIDDTNFKFTPQGLDSWGIGGIEKDKSLQSRISEANDLLKQGLDERKIYKLTDLIRKGEGWEDYAQNQNVSQAAYHPELFEAYNTDNLLFRNMPSLKDLGFGGNYDPSFNSILKSRGLSGRVDYDGSYDDAKSAVLHEIQHAIQEREGWPRGGNPEAMKEEALRILKRDVAIGEIPSISQAMDMLPIMQRNVFRRLTGEAQARATQDRLNMDMAQRHENYPLADDKLSDMPLEQLIYQYGDEYPQIVNRASTLAELLRGK